MGVHSVYKKEPVCFVFEGRLEKEAFLPHSLMGLIFYYVVLFCSFNAKIVPKLLCQEVRNFHNTKHRNLSLCLGISP